MKMTLVKMVLMISVALLLSVPSAANGIALKYTTSAYGDNEGVGMNSPEGIACSGNVVVVTDTGNNRLLRYSYANETLTPEGTFKVQELRYPIRLQIAPDGDIYVLDGKLLKIARAGQDGTFKGFMSFNGVPGTQEVIPRSFKVGGERGFIYILDVFGSRVLVVDGTGKYQRHIPFPQDHGFFSDLAVNYRGDVLLLDSIKGTLYAAPSDSQEFSLLANDLKEHARFPSHITADNQGTIFITDHHGGSILVIGLDGVIKGQQLGFGWNESLLNYPSQICIGSENHLFVADTNNSRVQIFKIIQ